MRPVVVVQSSSDTDASSVGSLHSLRRSVKLAGDPATMAFCTWPRTRLVCVALLVTE